MSRHRNLRHMIAEDDYYDDDGDGYYDGEDDDGFGYTPAATKKKKKKKKKAGAQQGQNDPTAAATTTATGTRTSPAPKPASESSGGGLQVISNPKKTPPPPGLTAPPGLAPPPGFSSSPPPPPRSISPPLSKPTTTTTLPPPSSQTATTATRKSPPRGPAASATTKAVVPPPPKPPPFLRQRHLDQRPPLTVVILGHVDAGKSTLTGHLLWLAAASAGSNKRAPRKPENLAWLLDQEEDERLHGVTMEVGTAVLSSPQQNTAAAGPRRAIVLQDAPGHADYVPSMITGTATADAAVVVVDATDYHHSAASSSSNHHDPTTSSSSQKTKRKNDLTKRGGGGQLREHLVLAKGLGIGQLVLAVNKMDLVGWDNVAAYRDICQQLSQFLVHELGYASQKLQFVPVSALTGFNIYDKKAATQQTSEPGSKNDKGAPKGPKTNKKPWYEEVDTLWQALDRLDGPAANATLLEERHLRIIVTDVTSEGSKIKGGVSVRGKILTGWVQQGEALTVLPIQDSAVVRKLTSLHRQQPTSDETFQSAGATSDTVESSGTSHNSNVEVAGAGEVVDLQLSGIQDASRLSVGGVLSRPIYVPPLATVCRCKIFVLDGLTVPIIRGATASFHIHHLDVPCHVSALLRTIKANNSANTQSPTPSSGGSNAGNSSSSVVVLRERPRALTARNTAIVEIKLLYPIAMEPFADCRPLGRFVLRRGGDSIAVGRVEQVLK